METIWEELEMSYIFDADGKWSIRNGKKYCLVEPSSEYLQKISDEELLNSLIPAKEEIGQAEFEVKVLTLLLDLGVVV